MAKRTFIFSDPDLCTGCRLCELVCSATKERGFNPLLSRIRIVRTQSLISMAFSCRLCEKPECVRICPLKVIESDEQSHIISINEEECDGCCLCIQVCNFGAIGFHLQKRMVFTCDLCQQTSNGTPQCVEFCPKDALKLVSPELISQKMRIKAVKELLG